jgi:hypothetical protein
LKRIKRGKRGKQKENDRFLLSYHFNKIYIPVPIFYESVKDVGDSLTET